MPKRPPLITAPFVLASASHLLQGLALHAYLQLSGFLSDLGATEDRIGVVFGVMSGAAIVIRPLAGRVMDSAGRRRVILAGSATNVVACALYLTVDEVGPWLLFVRVVHGFGEGAVFSSLFTYAADIIPEERRTEGIGWFGISGMLPLALGGLMSDFVLSVAGYRELFIVTAVLATLAFLVALGLREPERQRATVGRGFFQALRQPDLIPLWFVGCAFTLAVAGVFVFLKRYVEVEQIGSMGLFLSVYAAAAIVLRVGGGWIPDRVGPKRVLYPSLAAIGAGMLLLAWTRGEVGFAVAGILVGLGHGFAFPILSALVVARANPGDRGSAVSLLTAIFDLGVVVGGPLLGAIAEAADFRWMYGIVAGAPVLGGVVFAMWDRTPDRVAA